MNPFSLVQPGRWRATRPGRALCVALAALCLAGVAAAFPLRTVTLVVPFTPGGSNDTFARALATELSTAWGQSVIVENRPGGGGSVGAGLWWGLFAPPGLSDELVARLNADVNMALGSARLRELLSKEGASVSLFTPAQFSGFVRTELQRWREVVKKSNIRAE